MLRKDRPPRQDGREDGGGGLLTLVHQSVQFDNIDTSFVSSIDGLIEVQGISATIYGAQRNFFNVYIPPQSACPPNYSADLTSLLNYGGDIFVLGDLNALHAGWHLEGTKKPAWSLHCF